MAAVKSKKLLFRNISSNLTEEQLRVIINEVDDIDDSDLVNLYLTSADSTSVALVTFSTIAAADTVLEILNDTPLGPDFSSIEVTFALHEDVDRLERKQETQSVAPVKATKEGGNGLDTSRLGRHDNARESQPVDKLPRSSASGPLLPNTKSSSLSDGKHGVDSAIKTATSIPNSDYNPHKMRSTNQKSTKRFNGDAPQPSSVPLIPPTTKTTLHSGKTDTMLATSSNKEPKTESLGSGENESDSKPKPKQKKRKQKVGGSFILRIAKIDVAVDKGTFNRYMKMKKILATSTEYIDTVGYNEAILYFSCERDVKSAFDILQAHCSIGSDGMEAEVHKEKIDQPYQPDPEQQANLPDPKPESATELNPDQEAAKPRSHGKHSKNKKVSPAYPPCEPLARYDMQRPSKNEGKRQPKMSPHGGKPYHHDKHPQVFHDQPYQGPHQAFHDPPEAVHGPPRQFADQRNRESYNGIPSLMRLNTGPPPIQSYGTQPRQQYDDYYERQPHQGPNDPNYQRYNGPPNQGFDGTSHQGFDGPPHPSYNRPPDQRYGPSDYNYHKSNYDSTGPPTNQNYGRSPQHGYDELPNEDYDGYDRGPPNPNFKTSEPRDGPRPRNGPPLRDGPRPRDVPRPRVGPRPQGRPRPQGGPPPQDGPPPRGGPRPRGGPQPRHNTRPPTSTEHHHRQPPHNYIDGQPQLGSDRNQAYQGDAGGSSASDVSSRNQRVPQERHTTTPNRNPRQSRGPQPHQGARAKQDRGKLPDSADSTSDKVSRMFGTTSSDHDQFVDDSSADVDASRDANYDDNDSIFSGHSSASQSQTKSQHSRKPTSKSINVTGFDHSVKQASFQAFLSELGVQFITVNFRSAHGNQGPTAIVRFQNTRETANGKKLLDNAVMQSENNRSSKLRATYIYPDQGGRRGPMKAPPGMLTHHNPSDNASDAGSTTSSHYKGNHPRSTVLKVTGKQRIGIDPTLLSRFLQQRNILTLKTEFISENRKMHALLHFESPKECTSAKSQLFERDLAIGSTPVHVSYINPRQNSETTRGGSATNSDNRRPRSGSRGRQRNSETQEQPPKQPDPVRNSDQRCTQFLCVKVTFTSTIDGINESIDEDTFQSFLRRKQIHINNMKWSEDSGGKLYFSSELKAVKAQKIINGCEWVVNELCVQMKAELTTSEVSSTNPNRRPSRRRGSTTKHQNTGNKDVNEEDACSDVSTVDSGSRRRQERLATSVQVTNFNPDVDEDAFRGFLLDILKVDFSELQFFGRTAIIRFSTTGEATTAKELIHGRSLGNGYKRFKASQKGPTSVTNLKNPKPEEIKKGRKASHDETTPNPHPLKDHVEQSNGNPNDVMVDDIPRFVRDADMAVFISESGCKGFVNSVISSDSTTNKRSAVLTFDSRANAVEAIVSLYGKRLKGFCMNVRLAQEHSGLGELIIRKKKQALLDEIEDNRNKVAAELESKMNELALQVTEIDENLEDCDSINKAIVLDEQKKALRQQIDEVQNYQKEFDHVFSRLIQPKIEMLQSSISDSKSIGELDDLRQRFLRECRRVRNPLPIYGHKAFIMETITASDTNACVIRAETGSGKSTQVPQYLIEDVDFLNSASSGRTRKTVICTQPRRVAAISLARRVAEEYGCKVGEEVGYIAGNRRTTSPRTLLTYMTDRSLLNMCLSNDLDNCACVMIDEAHERTVDTDILLATLKGIQARRSDLKIIIMSATIDVDLFSKYLHGCPVISVPGRTFPVETKWGDSMETTGSGNYTSRAVEKVKEIHHKECPGDILVFLTSQVEIERACNQTESSLKGGDAVVLPLHGKLQPEDQMKVFKETSPGKRKIVFATNVAETSVTIPGIKYVVDTGVVKECQYDPQRNMSLLKVTGITQASAEQRKGRAGRTGPGVCYRLYAKSEYDEMEQSMKPEILRVHLGMAMLQLMKMGVKDVTTFDFVESPEKSAIEQAMQTLVYLGAVNHKNQLTSLGEKMAALPLEPRLAKLVLSGIETGLGEDAVTIAALVSAPGNIVYRGSSSEDQQISELMKMQFSSEGGDVLTMLKIYKMWLSIEDKGRNAWCKKNSMNAKTLRMVKENVSDISQILKKSLNITVEKSEPAEDDIDHSDLIKKILMSVYFENLCVFNGHAKAGYTILAQQKTAVIHPSSVLRSLGSHPKWLIYGDLRRTTQDFICDLTPFEAQWINAVVPKAFLDKIDIANLESNVMKETKMENVGTALMKHLAMKRFEKLRGLEDNITKDTDTPCIIEANWEAGSLNIFIASRACNHARQKITGYLEDEKKQARLEQREIPVGTHGSIRHVVVSGGETGFVLMKDEYRSLDISNIPNQVTEDEMIQLCGCRPDQVKDVFKFPSHWFQAKRGDWGRVTFLNPSDAQQVKTFLESKTYQDEEEHISAQPSLPKQNRGGVRARPAIETAVEVTWFLGRAKGFGFISCQTTADALSLIGDINGLPIRGKAIIASLKKDVSQVVYIKGIDVHVTQEEMEQILKKTTRVAFNSVSIPHNKPTMNISNAMVKRQLRNCFEVDAKDRLDINILDPRSEKSQRRKGFLNFDPSLQHQITEKIKELETAPLYTAAQEMYHFRILVTSSHYCTQYIYAMLKDQIDELISSAEEADEDITIKITELKRSRDHDGQKITISGSDYMKVLDVRTVMHALLNGEQIPVEELAGENKPEQWIQRSLMNLTQERLREYIGDTTAFMKVDSRSGVVHIYGKKEDREELKNVLLNYFTLLTQTKLNEMRLPLSVLRALIRRYGPWLKDLKEETGVEEITIYLKKGMLMITGSEEAQKKVTEKIKACSNDTKEILVSSDGDDCGICFCPADRDAKTYRLLSCGHYYCLECLQDFLYHSVTAKAFPVICPTEDCNECLMLDDIRFIYPKEEKQNQLFRASLEAYVAQKSKQNQLKFCPTPDCCMIYKQMEQADPWTCTECGQQVCSACGQEPHPKRMTCAEYRINKQSSDAIWNWVRTSGTDNVKRCPTPDCGIIEKFEGCNHVPCPSCRKHICWKCMALFDNSEECYAHLSNAHKGCFDHDF